MSNKKECERKKESLTIEETIEMLSTYNLYIII